MDIELQTTEITTEPIEITTPNVEVCTGNEDIELVVTRKEFNVVGDSIYIGNRIDDTPQWLVDYIDNLNAMSLDAKINDINGISESLEDLIDAMNVAKNAYTSAIITYEELETMVNAKVETLNSTLAGSDATLLDLVITKVTPDEAQTLATQVLNASIDDGRINALIGDVQEAIANESSARATDIEILTASIFGLDGEVAATAEAIETLEAAVSDTLNESIADIQDQINILTSQVDGVVETVTDTHDVMVGTSAATSELVTTAEPYASWLAAEVDNGENVRASHIGDSYIKYQTEADGSKTYLASYKFIKTTIDDSSPYSTDSKGYTWAIITDTDTQSAYTLALEAYDLADSKRRVFVDTDNNPATGHSPSAPYNIGDLWVDNNGNGTVLKRCYTIAVPVDGALPLMEQTAAVYTAGDWSIAATDDTAVTTLETGLADGSVEIKLTNAYVGDELLSNYLADELDGLVVVFSGTNHSTQTGMDIGDIYIESTTATSPGGLVVDVTNTYKYDGITWVQINNNSHLTALADLADGKRTVFSGNTVPAGAVARDIWIPSADVLITNSTMCGIAGGTWTTVCSIPKYSAGEIYQYSATSKWLAATRYTNDLTIFKTGDFQTLQDQVDGQITYWYNSTATTAGEVTTQLNSWKAAWTTAELKRAHHSDIAYFTKMVQGYYYDRITNSWIAVSDNAALKALDDASKAKSAADGKVTAYSVVFALARGSDTSKNYVVVSNINSTESGTVTGVLWSYVNNTWTNLVLSGTVKSGDMITGKRKQLIFKTDDQYEDVDVTYAWYLGWSELDGRIVSTANWSIGLHTDIETLDDSIYGDSGLESTLKAEISDTKAEVESKFAYNSTLALDGVNYVTGFGLQTELSQLPANSPVGYSEFWVKADNFKMVAASQTAAAQSPFSVDAVTGDITFNGKVSFNSVTDAPPMVAENTNINQTSNLVPALGWQQDNHADYLFVGSPTYSRVEGATVGIAEDTLALDSTDEVYTPYVEDMTVSYTMSFAFKGNVVGKVLQVSSTDVVTSTEIVPNGLTLDSNTWYIAKMLVVPTGTITTGSYGAIVNANTQVIVGTVSNIVLAGTTTKMLLGFSTAGTGLLSRVSISIISSEVFNEYYTATQLSNVAASVNGKVDASDIYTPNTTTIDGGKITTGSITAGQIATNTITTSQLSTNIGLVNGYIYSSNFNGNTVGAIGSPTQGFRLSSNAAGTSTDPTIYGAYIRGAKIELYDLVTRSSDGISGIPIKTFYGFKCAGKIISSEYTVFVTGITSADYVEDASHQILGDSQRLINFDRVSVINFSNTSNFTYMSSTDNFYTTANVPIWSWTVLPTTMTFRFFSDGTVGYDYRNVVSEQVPTDGVNYYQFVLYGFTFRIKKSGTYYVVSVNHENNVIDTIGHKRFELQCQTQLGYSGTVYPNKYIYATIQNI